MEQFKDQNQMKITDNFTKSEKDENKIRDTILAAYIATHCSINSIDHLNEILRDLKFYDIQLHRTKCTSLIKYVIASKFLRELIEDIDAFLYSIYADKSTDVSKKKYICLCIRYFSQKKKRHLTDFLGLLEIVEADAESLYSVVLAFFNKIKLPIMNMIALGMDGGSSLCGCNHSLYTLLKAKIPHLQLIKCVCHSLNWAASSAADEFPSSIEFLLRE